MGTWDAHSQQYYVYPNNALYGQEGLMTPVAKLKGPHPLLAAGGTINGRTLAGSLFETPDEKFVQDMEEDGNDATMGNVGEEDNLEWDSRRPYLTGSHVWQFPADSESDQRVDQVSKLSPSLQEVVLLDDLLYSFMGLEGKYVRFRFGESSEQGRELVEVELISDWDKSLRALATRALPIAKNVVTLQRFIETRSAPEYGLVCHAISAGMRQILDDWFLMVTQLENHLRTGRLTMQSLWFYVQPPYTVLLILSEIAEKSARGGLTGAAVLNLLHSKLGEYAGDQNAQVLLQKLLKDACVPYFGIMEKWLCEGLLDDPYNEFMIKENTAVGKMSTTEDMQSGYWRNRYTIYTQEGMDSSLYVPRFLKEHQEMVLTTGKYLNAMRECGKVVQRPLDPGEHIIYDSGNKYVQLIHKSHKAASQAFLDFFMNDLKLVHYLTGLKHFFLLDQGDVISHLMDIAEEEFSKPPSLISHTRLQSLLELAVRTSSIPAETNSEPLAFEFDPRSLMEFARMAFRAGSRYTSRASSIRSSRTEDDSSRIRNRSEELRGYDVFMISYRVDWPMTLIVSPRQMIQYQLMFKHLFLLKRVERALDRAWQALQFSRGITDRGLCQVQKRTYLLCHKMMHVFQQYLRFVTVELLEPQWHTLQQDLVKAKTVDKVFEVHKDFLNKVMKHGLLRKAKVVALFERLEADALGFTDLITRAFQVDDMSEEPVPLPRSVHDRRLHAAAQRAYRSEKNLTKIKEALATEEYCRSLQEIENTFGTHMHNLIAQIKEIYDVNTTNKSEGNSMQLDTREDVDRLLNLMHRLTI